MDSRLILCGQLLLLDYAVQCKQADWLSDQEGFLTAMNLNTDVASSSLQCTALLHATQCYVAQLLCVCWETHPACPDTSDTLQNTVETWPLLSFVTNTPYVCSGRKLHETEEANISHIHFDIIVLLYYKWLTGGFAGIFHWKLGIIINGPCSSCKTFSAGSKMKAPY